MSAATVIVGAGVAGLTVAAGLDGQRTIVDRLPAVGGVLGYDHPAVRCAGARAVDAGAALLLGTTAVRWDGSRVLVVGPRGVEWLPADRLVIAAGSRPAVAAELSVVGPRLAGVFAATVAIHLGEAGVRFGRRACLVGDSDWGRRASRIMTEGGTEVVGVTTALDGGAPAYGDAWWRGWTPVAVDGRGRVSRLIVARHGIAREIRCDTVVLADGIRPMRNVDGALTPRPGLAFVQPSRPIMTVEEVGAEAAAAVEQLRRGERQAVG